MRFISQDPSVDFSGNYVGFGGIPTDTAADYSAIFSASGASLVMKGIGLLNTTPGSGVTVGGDAFHAQLTVGTSSAIGLDTGFDPQNENGFSMLAVINIPNGGEAGGTPTGIIYSSNNTTYTDGLWDYNGGIESQVTSTNNHGNFGGTGYGNSLARQSWQVFGWDLAANGNYAIYTGSGGVLSTITGNVTGEINLHNIIGATLPIQIISGTPNYSLGIAMLNIYKGANRLSPAGFAAQYDRLQAYYNGNLSNTL